MLQNTSQEIDYEEITKLYRLNATDQERKNQRDQELKKIIEGHDQRVLLIIGPCSAHDQEAVIEYAQRLANLQKKVANRIFMIIRVYTNKPRTNGDGYKGLTHQPDSTGILNPISGIIAKRQLHYRVLTETGLTTADELLYPEQLHFIADLVSYHTIGARSVEDQQHRFVASLINAPTGLKNPTSGNLQVLFNSLYAAQKSQNFVFNSQAVQTQGNPWAHVILRGATNEYGDNIPNYYYENLQKVINLYEENGLTNPFIVIDTNHDNSGKKFLEQIRITHQTLFNRKWSHKLRQYVRGLMIESFLVDGQQDLPGKVFGQSITDPCLGWEKTEELIKEIYDNYK